MQSRTTQVISIEQREERTDEGTDRHAHTHTRTHAHTHTRTHTHTHTHAHTHTHTHTQIDPPPPHTHTHRSNGGGCPSSPHLEQQRGHGDVVPRGSAQGVEGAQDPEAEREVPRGRDQPRCAHEQLHRGVDEGPELRVVVVLSGEHLCPQLQAVDVLPAVHLKATGATEIISVRLSVRAQGILLGF